MKITVLQWLQEEKLLKERLAEKEESPAVKRKAALKEENLAVKRKAALKDVEPAERKKAALNAREDDDKFVKNLQSSTRLAICIPFSKLYSKS